MTLLIDAVHCGPPHSGNGGWVCGLLAEQVPTTAAAPAVTVRLASPPPLDTPLTTGGYGSLVVLQHGSTQIASATAAPATALPDELPSPATVLESAGAEERYEGLREHPFPTCFSCGTDRDPAEALCLRPGPLDDGTSRYAARWTPRESSVPLVWAALDCPGGWAAGVAGRPMVLGSMTALVHRLPVVGETHVVTAWQQRSEGRKHFSGSMLHSPEGELIAVADAIWIAVEPASIRPVGLPESHGRRATS